MLSTSNCRHTPLTEDEEPAGRGFKTANSFSYIQQITLEGLSANSLGFPRPHKERPALKFTTAITVQHRTPGTHERRGAHCPLTGGQRGGAATLNGLQGKQMFKQCEYIANDPPVMTKLKSILFLQTHNRKENKYNHNCTCLLVSIT